MIGVGLGCGATSGCRGGRRRSRTARRTGCASWRRRDGGWRVRRRHIDRIVGRRDCRGRLSIGRLRRWPAALRPQALRATLRRHSALARQRPPLALPEPLNPDRSRLPLPAPEARSGRCPDFSRRHIGDRCRKGRRAVAEHGHGHRRIRRSAQDRGEVGRGVTGAGERRIGHVESRIGGCRARGDEYRDDRHRKDAPFRRRLARSLVWAIRFPFQCPAGTAVMAAQVFQETLSSDETLFPRRGMRPSEFASSTQ